MQLVLRSNVQKDAPLTHATEEARRTISSRRSEATHTLASAVARKRAN